MATMAMVATAAVIPTLTTAGVTVMRVPPIGAAIPIGVYVAPIGAATPVTGADIESPAGITTTGAPQRH
jgi:hypothetical protein